MKTKLMALMLLAGGALLAAPRVAIGVQIGAPAPVYVHSYRPYCPGPGYVWTDGYYDPYGNWFDGYWALPPYTGAYWVAPRYYGGRFFTGYWGGWRGHRYAAPYVAPFRREFEFREHGRGRGHGRHGDYYRGFRR